MLKVFAVFLGITDSSGPSYDVLVSLQIDENDANQIAHGLQATSDAKHAALGTETWNDEEYFVKEIEVNGVGELPTDFIAREVADE